MLLVESELSLNNKLWNALKLVKMWEARTTDNGRKTTAESNFAVDWFDNRLNEAKAEIDQLFKEFRLSEALKTIYSLIWDDFCSWYLEWVKPGFEQPIDAAVYNKTVSFFEELMQLLHPFMPFITEEIWHELKERKEKEYLIVAEWPKKDKFDKEIISKMESILSIVGAIRNIRNSKNIAHTKALELSIKVMSGGDYEQFMGIIRKLANITEISFVQENIEGAISFVEAGDEFFIPMEGNIDVAAERDRLQKELEYTKGFLKSVVSKLSNERFVKGAPESVISNERKKQADAEAKINAIEQSLASL